MKRPRVTIGVPVRNGGDLFATAMRSIINQSEQDLEIIISDNASDDGTGEFAKTIAESDRRIHYFLQRSPLSAYDNFRFVLSKANGQYFMWAAHDDSRDLDFIAKLADELDQDPAAVLAFGDVQIITAADPVGRPYPFDFSTTGLGRLDRLIKTSSMQCFHIYGLWRLPVIQRVPYAFCPWWPDLPIMMAAASFGPFRYVSGTRFYYYEVVKQNLDRVKYQDYSRRFDLPSAVLQLVGATYSSCSLVANRWVGCFAAGLVLWKQARGLPGHLYRKMIRLSLPCMGKPFNR
ncbi:glycosyltransferase family 2 protein [Synechococcus sp. HJ21-Hayes]|uniref:glycosyltransferase family 2 protein n=1 Tax=unclassified Synechococcus TaxID=2626047 RepID=UPI0020CBC8A6|nr:MULTISPECIES: glycosyltransferase family A protein [unclassified Synechococcus]MCP9830096.1 glycosyltransferase family 2 protein [Synechococcus sp. JJ3a-Johnson]MCP9852096.1 glycosyltransferase family 2 protein [Synechococcus sp. HJ21-Hayes]